ncbi:MAG: MarR family transcriptional regulator [Bacteroidales bacterium]
MEYDQLKLSNQLCFPVYAASRLITREYQPYMHKLGITYPQYLVMMVLWEHDGLTVNEIAMKLILNTNTITPLLKRMEGLGFITRTRSGEDERKVVIRLTGKGKEMRVQAAIIPGKLLNRLDKSPLIRDDLIRLQGMLNRLVDFMSK